MARIKIFSEVDSSSMIIRRKLFCDESSKELAARLMRCGDCGFKLESKSTTTDIVCPKCGGTRFDVVREFYSPENTPEPVKVEKDEEEKTSKKRLGLFSVLPGEEDEFQKSFSDTEDEFELKLKEYSGSELSREECDSIFGSSEVLTEKGFAEVTEADNIKILDTAFLQSRLFSKLTIQVIKTLELDPEVIGMPFEKKPEVIESLEDKISPKGVIMIKKAHGFPIVNEENSWAKDSGITNDLPIEFGGQKKPMPEFLEIIKERYPDAPDHIIEILKSKGIIKSDGNLVEIQK